MYLNQVYFEIIYIKLIIFYKQLSQKMSLCEVHRFMM
jgi:hypothetical protein